MTPRQPRQGPQDRRQGAGTTPLVFGGGRNGRNDLSASDGPYECATCHTVWATLAHFDNHRKDHR